MIVTVYNESLVSRGEFDRDSGYIEAPTWDAVLEEFKARWWFETDGQRFFLVRDGADGFGQARVVTAHTDAVRLELGL